MAEDQDSQEEEKKVEKRKQSTIDYMV